MWDHFYHTERHEVLWHFDMRNFMVGKLCQKPGTDGTIHSTGWYLADCRRAVRDSFAWPRFLPQAAGTLPLLAIACLGLAAAAGHPKPLLQDGPEIPEPHERTMLRVNPPTFRWPEAEGANSYELQISRTADFEQAPTVTKRT